MGIDYFSRRAFGKLKAKIRAFQKEQRKRDQQSVVLDMLDDRYTYYDPQLLEFDTMIRYVEKGMA